jgi:hypothetical protein
LQLVGRRKAKSSPTCCFPKLRKRPWTIQKSDRQEELQRGHNPSRRPIRDLVRGSDDLQQRRQPRNYC